MQRPCPTEVMGVPVQIRVIQDATGSRIDLGFAQTDLYGHFSFEWIPPVSGRYTIVARFLGNDANFPSWEATGLWVAKEVPTPQPQVVSIPDYMPMLVGLTAAVAVAIVVGVVNLWMLRRRK